MEDEGGMGEVTHKIQGVLLRKAIGNGCFLEREQFVQVVVEFGVSFPDFPGSFERKFFWL